jgi:hypothetical protein
MEAAAQRQKEANKKILPEAWNLRHGRDIEQDS